MLQPFVETFSDARCIGEKGEMQRDYETVHCVDACPKKKRYREVEVRGKGSPSLGLAT